MEHLITRLYDPELYAAENTEGRQTVLKELMSICRNDLIVDSTAQSESPANTTQLPLSEAKDSAFTIIATMIDFHSSIDGLQEAIDDSEKADTTWWGYSMLKALEGQSKNEDPATATSGAAHASSISTIKSNFFSLFADIIIIFTQHASVAVGSSATPTATAVKPTKKHRAEKASEVTSVSEVKRIPVSLLDAGGLLAVHDFFNINLIEAGTLTDALGFANVSSSVGTTATMSHTSTTDGEGREVQPSPQDVLLASAFVTGAPTKSAVEKLIVFRGIILMARALLLATTLNYGHNLESVGTSALPLGKSLMIPVDEANAHVQSALSNAKIPSAGSLPEGILATDEPESVQALFVSVDEVRRLLIGTYRTAAKSASAAYLVSLQEQLHIVISSVDGHDDGTPAAPSSPVRHEAIVKASSAKKETLVKAILAKLLHQRLYMEAIRDIGTLALSDLLRILTLKPTLGESAEMESTTATDLLEFIICPRGLVGCHSDLSDFAPVHRPIRPIIHFGANPEYLCTIENIEDGKLISFGLHPVAAFIVDSFSRNLNDSLKLFNDVAVEASSATPSAVFSAMLVVTETKELANPDREDKHGAAPEGADDNANGSVINTADDQPFVIHPSLNAMSLYKVFAFATTPLAATALPALATLTGIIRPHHHTNNNSGDSAELSSAFASLNPLRQAVAARLVALSAKCVAAAQYIFSEADPAKGTGYAFMIRKMVASSCSALTSSATTHSAYLDAPSSPTDSSSGMTSLAMSGLGHRTFALFPSVYWLLTVHSSLTLSLSWLLATHTLQPRQQQTAGRQQQIGNALYSLVEALRVDTVVATGQFNGDSHAAEGDNANSSAAPRKTLVNIATEEGDEPLTSVATLSLSDDGPTATVRAALSSPLTNRANGKALYAPEPFTSFFSTSTSGSGNIAAAYVSLPATGLWLAHGIVLQSLTRGLSEISHIATDAFRQGYENSAEKAQFDAMIALATAPKKNIFKTSAGYMTLDSIVDTVIRSLQNMKVHRSSIFVDYSTNSKRMKAIETADLALHSVVDDEAEGAAKPNAAAPTFHSSRNHLKESEEAAALEPANERAARNSILRTTLSAMAQIHVFDHETPAPLDENLLLIKWLHTTGRNVSVRRAAYGAQRREIRRINGLDAGGLSGAGGNIPLGAMIHRIQNGTYALQKARDAINNVTPRARIHQAAFGSLLRGFHRLAGSGASEAALRQAQALVSRSLAHSPAQVRDRCEDMLCSYLSEAIADATNRQIAITAAHPPGTVAADHTYQSLLAPSNQRSVLSLCLQCLYATVAQSACAKSAGFANSSSDAGGSSSASSAIQLSTSDDAATNIDAKRPLEWIMATTAAQEAEHQQFVKQSAAGKRARGQGATPSSSNIVEVPMTSAQSAVLFEADEMQKGNRYSILATRLWSTMLNLSQGSAMGGGLTNRILPQNIHNRAFFDFIDACPMITNYMWSFWHRHLCLSEVTRRVELGMEMLCYTAQTRPAYRGRALASLLYFSSLEKAKVARSEAILRLREFLTSPVTMAYCTGEERDAYIKLFADYCLLKCDRLGELIKSVGSVDAAGSAAAGDGTVILTTPKAGLRYHLLTEEKIRQLQNIMDFEYDNTSLPCATVFEHYVDRLRLLQSWTTQGGAPMPPGVNPLSSAGLEYAFAASNEEASLIVKTNFALLCALCQIDARQSVPLIKKLLEVYAISATLSSAQLSALEVLSQPPAIRALNAQTQAANLGFSLQRLYLGSSLCNAILQSPDIESVLLDLFGKVRQEISPFAVNGNAPQHIDFSQQELFATRFLPMVRQYPVGAGDLACKIMSTAAVAIRGCLTELSQLPTPLTTEQHGRLNAILTIVISHCKFLFTSRSALSAMAPASVFANNPSSATFTSQLFASALSANSANKAMIDTTRAATQAFSNLVKTHAIVPGDIRMILPVLGFIDRVELRDVYVPAFVRLFAATEPLRMPIESTKVGYLRSLLGAEIVKNSSASETPENSAYLSVLQGTAASVYLSLQEALWHMLAPCDIPTSETPVTQTSATNYLSPTSKRGVGPLDFLTAIMRTVDGPRRTPNNGTSATTNPVPGQQGDLSQVAAQFDQLLLFGSPNALQVGSRLVQMLMTRSTRPSFAPISCCGATTKQPIISLLSELQLMASPSPAASEFALQWVERFRNNNGVLAINNFPAPIAAFVPQTLLLGSIDSLKYRLRKCPDSMGSIDGRAIQYEQLLTEWLKAITTRLTTQVQDELQRGADRNYIQAGSYVLVQQLIAHLVPPSLLPAAAIATLAGPTVNKILTTSVGRGTVTATAFPKTDSLVKAVDVSSIVDRFQKMDLPAIASIGNAVSGYWGKTPIEVLWMLFDARHINAIENDPNYSEHLRIRGVRAVEEAINEISISILVAPQQQQQQRQNVLTMEAQQLMAWALFYAEEHWSRVESHLLTLPDRSLVDLFTARPKLCASFVSAHERNPKYQHMIPQLREMATF